MRSEICDRRRRHADVDHVGAGLVQAVGERRDELGPGETSVARERERGRAALDAERTEGAPDLPDDLGSKGFSDYAADVVGAKDFVG